MILSDHLVLSGGRRLEVRTSGPAAGMPLVFHHGTPAAAAPIRALERRAHDRGLRLVTMSRPGYGGSDRDPGRSVADVVADTRAVLQALGADRCLIAGWSGGGPHALACAARLEHAVGALAIASVAPFDAEGLDWMIGMGEENVTEFNAALEGEDALRNYLTVISPFLKDSSPEGIVAMLASILPDVDRSSVTDEFGEDMATNFHDALLHGVDGWLDDDLAFLKPWGFSLDEISTPTSLWQGSLDLMVPFAHGEWLAAHLPRAVAHLEQGEGHFSVAIGAMDRMLDELISIAGPT